jgi:TfoX/Sxy family transcriptional regulator of competence genes
VASKQSIVDYLVDQMGRGVSAKKMFGEYGLYLDGVLFALVCDDTLFVKPTEEGRRLLGDVREAPPYPGAKNAFVVEGDRWDDGDWLAELARVTKRALPPAKPKPKPASKPKATAKATPKPTAKAKAKPTAKATPKSRAGVDPSRRSR